MKALASLFSFFILTACTQPPVLDTPPPSLLDGPEKPRIEPIEGLIIRALGPSPGGRPAAQLLEDISDPMIARVRALERRAAILRGAPVDATTRGRLAEG